METEIVTNDLVADKHQKALPRLKKSVETSHQYFKKNYKRFNKFRKFVFESSVSAEEGTINEAKNFPTSEFNIANAYVSRLCGEFAKQEPSIEVSSADGSTVDKELAAQIEVVEGHFRHLLEEAEHSGTQYQTYRDELSGGWGILSLITEYMHPMSLDLVMRLRKAKYPTMCGFDPMATEPHKGDGKFSYKIYPRRKDEFKKEHPKVDLQQLKFVKAPDSFGWSFDNGVEDILLECEFFEKKTKKVKIMKLVDGRVLTEKEYKESLDKWQQEGHVEQHPGIYGEPRITEIETIWRYIFIENQVLKCEKTDYSYLPDVFADGDSVDLYDDNSGKIQQFTRPYIYHAMGAQNLKNLSTQALMNQIESVVQHKFIIKKEAIPEEEQYINNITNYQKAGLIVVNAYMDNEPNSPIPEPIIPVTQQACPPEIIQGITMADNIMQNVLGSFDAQLGINKSQVSNLTFTDAVTQSNNVAMPYATNYLLALNQCGLNFLSLIPKIWKTPRTIPIIDKNGERSFKRINDENDPNSINIKYDPYALQIKIKPGVNFAIQKSRALQIIVEMMKASESFAAFMNSKGLQVLIDNLEIRGTDILKELAKEYQEEMQQQQAKQMQMAEEAHKNDPRVIKNQIEMQKLQGNKEQNALSNEIKKEELEVKREANAINAAVMIDKAEAEKIRAMADMGVKAADMSHRHTVEHHQLKHNIEMDHKKHEHEVKKGHQE